MLILEGSMNELMPLIQEQLASGGKARLNVTGTSMTPFLQNGKDGVLLAPADHPKTRDIILYRRPSGRYVLHRIIRRYEDYCLCCGDNQWFLETVSLHQVEAVVCARYRNEKREALKGFRYWCYVNHLPLRRLYCRLRDLLCRE